MANQELFPDEREWKIGGFPVTLVLLLSVMGAGVLFLVGKLAGIF